MRLTHRGRLVVLTAAGVLVGLVLGPLVWAGMPTVTRLSAVHSFVTIMSIVVCGTLGGLIAVAIRFHDEPGSSSTRKRA